MILAVKQLKGKGKKCQLHTHLHDVMRKKNRGTRSGATYRILCGKERKAIKFLRLETPTGRKP